MRRANRYLTTASFRAAAGEPAPFPGLRARQPGPATAILEHTLTSADRLDLLAIYYYNDARLWWRILDANPEILCGAELADPARVGTIVLIPPAAEPGSE